MLLAWGGLSWWIDWQNGSLLSKQVAVLFPLQGSSAALILLTGILGALLGGVAAWQVAIFAFLNLKWSDW